MTIRRFLLPMIFLLAGCGDNADPTDVQSSAANHAVFSVETDNPIVKRELPFIRQQCPGLDKYAVNFDKFEVSDDSMRPVTTVQFHIKDDNNIPNNYAASGNNCFLFISNNAQEVKISKSACQSVCLDRMDVPGGDMVIKLDKEKSR
ncbi:TPA: hypothetical protein ACU9XO_001238 [Citrobacter freundii]